MAKSKDNQTPGKNPAAADENDGPKDERESSLKVAQSDAQLVGKVATMRGVSVKNLFKMKDVSDFFTHLLLEEMRLESERLKRKKN